MLHWTDNPYPSDDGVSVLALDEAGKITVTWQGPTLGPGQVITGYSVQYRIRGTSSYSTRSVSGSGTTSYTITNLNLGTVYEVRVASVGPLGVSGYCCGSGKQVKTYNCECRLSKDSFCSDISLNYTCRDCHASASNRTHSLLKLLMLHRVCMFMYAWTQTCRHSVATNSISLCGQHSALPLLFVIVVCQI